MEAQGARAKELEEGKWAAEEGGTLKGARQGTQGWKELRHAVQGKGRPRPRSWGSQEDAEKWGACHAVERRDLRKQRDKGAALPSAEGEEGRKHPGRWSRCRKQKRQRVGGDSKKGKERGRAGRKEELLEESPGEPGRRAGEDGWSGSSQGPRKGFLSVIVLEPPPMSGPSQLGLPVLLRTHRYRQAYGRPPASLGPHAPLTQGSQPASFLPTCHPLPGAEPGNLLGPTAPDWVVLPSHFIEEGSRPRDEMVFIQGHGAST